MGCVSDFLQRLSENGVHVYVYGNTLKIRSKDKAAFEKYGQDIKDHKAEIIKHLTAANDQYPETYKRQIRKGWAGWVQALQSNFMYYDGLTKTDAHDAATEILTLTCSQIMRMAHQSGLTEIYWLIDNEVKNAVKD